MPSLPLQEDKPAVAIKPPTAANARLSKPLLKLKEDKPVPLHKLEYTYSSKANRTFPVPFMRGPAGERMYIQTCEYSRQSEGRESASPPNSPKAGPNHPPKRI